MADQKHDYGFGDRLARGGTSATFGSMSHVTDEQWPYPPPTFRKKKRTRKKAKKAETNDAANQ